MARSRSWLIVIVRTMKAKLIELLLSSPSGKAVRNALRLSGEEVFTEVLSLILCQAADRGPACDVRAIISRVGEAGTLSGEAVEVDFGCLETLALGFSYDDDQQAEFDGLQAALDIDTGDRFRIFCQGFVVKNVRAYNLADEPR